MIYVYVSELCQIILFISILHFNNFLISEISIKLITYSMFMHFIIFSGYDGLGKSQFKIVKHFFAILVFLGSNH